MRCLVSCSRQSWVAAAFCCWDCHRNRSPPHFPFHPRFPPVTLVWSWYLCSKINDFSFKVFIFAPTVNSTAYVRGGATVCALSPSESTHVHTCTRKSDKTRKSCWEHYCELVNWLTRWDAALHCACYYLRDRLFDPRITAVTASALTLSGTKQI